jgi:hypothetical protein
MRPTRTVHPMTCVRCQGSGIRPFHNGAAWTTALCDHTHSMSETGPDEDELRIARLEDAVTKLMAELDGCRDEALEEAAALVGRAAKEWRDYGEIGPSEGLGDVANAIRALKGNKP